MILSLIAALFVLLVAAFWAMQGVFSSAIMLIETIVALMVAFGYYEPVAGLATEYIPEYAHGAALVLLFAVTLTVLRLLTDKFIPGNVQFPMPVDRAGGGLLGLLTGLLLIGTTLTGVQMLPIGPAPLGFQRVSFDPPGRRSIWLNPDGFAVSMAGLLSTGRFGGEPLERAHPDFLGELATTNTGFQVESRRIVPPNSMAVKNYWQVDAIDAVTQTQQGETWKRDFTKSAPDDSSRKFMIVRVAIDGIAADKTDGTNEPSFVRFTPAQFRLVGKAGDGAGAMSPVVIASGLSDIFSEKVGSKLDPFRAQRVVKWKADQRFGLGNDNAAAIAKDGKYQIDVAFEVAPEFSPWFVQFKANGRAEMNPSQMLKKPPPMLEPPKPPPPKKGKKSDSEDDEDDADDAPAKGISTGSKKETAEPAADSDDEDEGDSGTKNAKTPAKKDDSGDEDEDSAAAKKPAGAKKPAKKDDSSAADEDEDSSGDEKPAKSKKPSKKDEEEGDDKSDGEDAAAAAPKKPKVGEKAAGRTNVASAVEEATGVSAKLPVTLKKSDVPASSLAGGKFKEGHVVIEDVGGKVAKADAVTKFDVPEDLVMVQVGAEKNFAGSTLGQALEFAKQALAQIFVTSEAGDQYFALGVYTAATVSGKRVLELQYWPGKREEVPERALEPAKRLTTNLLRMAANSSDLKMGFLFLVPKGTHLVKFNTTSRNGQAIDIDVK